MMMMLIRARRSHSIINATVFLSCFFCCMIVCIHAQLRTGRKEVSTSHNEHRNYQRRSPNKVKGRQPRDKDRDITTTASSVHTPHEKDVHNKKDVLGLYHGSYASDYVEHRHLMVTTKQSHKQKKNVRVGPFYYKRIEHVASETVSEIDEHVYYRPNKKASPSNKSSKSSKSFFIKASKSKQGPMAEIDMEKRIIPYRHSTHRPGMSSNKSGESSNDAEFESVDTASTRVDEKPYRHDSQEPANDIKTDRAERFYQSDRRFSHAPVSAPVIAISAEAKLGPEIESHMEKRFYPRVGQQRLNDQPVPPKASNVPSETNPVYTPFTNKLFGNGHVTITTPKLAPEIETSDMETRFYPRFSQQQDINHDPVPAEANNGPLETNRVYTPFADTAFGNGPVNKTTPTVVLQTQERAYTPFSDRIFGHELGINKAHEVSATDKGDDVTFGGEEEVQANELTQLDEISTAFPCFSNRMDLVAAVDEYLLDNGPNTFVAQTYGWPIGTWCVSQVKSFHSIFSANRNSAASTFKEDLSNWDVSNATSTQNMFEGSAIDQDFSTWNTSAVKSMNSMFSHTPSFQGKGLSKWDTSAVTDMSFMFSNAISLREDISSWNVSCVKSTWGMFQFASSFNHDLSPWTLRGLVSMDLMFKSATSFRHDLCAWKEHVPKDLVNTYGVFTMSNCPNTSDPDLSAYSPGPFCFDCRANR